MTKRIKDPAGLKKFTGALVRVLRRNYRARFFGEDTLKTTVSPWSYGTVVIHPFISGLMQYSANDRFKSPQHSQCDLRRREE